MISSLLPSPKQTAPESTVVPTLGLRHPRAFPLFPRVLNKLGPVPVILGVFLIQNVTVLSCQHFGGGRGATESCRGRVCLLLLGLLFAQLGSSIFLRNDMSSSRFCFLLSMAMGEGVVTENKRNSQEDFRGGSLKGRRDDRRKTPLFYSCSFLPAAWNVDAVTRAAAHILTHRGWKPNAGNGRARRETQTGPQCDREATTPACSGLLIHYRENSYAFKPLFLEFSVGVQYTSSN